MHHRYPWVFAFIGLLVLVGCGQAPESTTPTIQGIVYVGSWDYQLYALQAQKAQSQLFANRISSTRYLR